MRLRALSALGLPLGLLLASPPEARGDRAIGEPAVARPRFELDGRTLGSGTAFFVPAPDEVGVAAVTTAHAFERAELVRAEEVIFRLGRSGEPVAYASRLLAEPGRPFSDPGGTLREDYLVFALDAPPRGVRVLELDADAGDLEGERVRILGVPASIPQDEDDLFGTVRDVTETRIEVDLDVPADLRGWGGAPVLRHPEGTVVGVLQAAWPQAETLRLGVAPLGGIRAALARPLDAGRGRPFAAFAGAEGPADPPSEEPPREGSEPADEKTREPATATASGPSSSSGEAGPATEPAAPERTADAAETPEPPAEREPADPPAPEPTAAATRESPAPPLGSEAAVSARRAATPREEGEPLLGEAGATRPEVLVEVETPADGAIVGDAETGAFVAGRALALLGELQRFDVMIVLDTSGSTGQMTGADVNGNGVVGQGGLRGIFGDTDPGDSILAAEVAAARRLLESFDPRTTRVGLVTFAGQDRAPPGTFVIGGGHRGPDVIVEQALTADYERIDRALRHVQERGPAGLTNMAQAVDRAWVELTGIAGGGLSEVDEDSEKVILFLTDGQPTLPYEPMFEAENVQAVLRAADRASRVRVTIHSFALGPEALEGPIATVEMAGRTGGAFTPVRRPGDIVDVIENVSLANVETVEIRNLSTGGEATQLQTSPDGSFSALVPLQTGKNRIEVVARAAEGAEARREIEVSFAPGAPPPSLPRHLLAQRTRLLERKLVEIRRERLAAERDQAEETRKELKIEIERERRAARERAETQRKELRIEAEPLEAPGPPREPGEPGRGGAAQPEDPMPGAEPASR